MNKIIPVCYGHDVFTSYLLYEVKYHASFEEAVREANKYRNLARVDKYRIIQVGDSGDNIMVFKYEPKIVSWAVTSTPVWSEKQIEKFSNEQHLKHHQQFEHKTLREICGMPSGSIGNHGNTYGIIAEEEAAIIDDLKRQMEAKIPQLLDQTTHCPKCGADIRISQLVVDCTKCTWFYVPLQVSYLFKK